MPINNLRSLTLFHEYRRMAFLGGKTQSLDVIIWRTNPDVN